MPAAMMPRIQTTWKIRTIVIICFASRLAVVGTTIGHITTLGHFRHLDEATWTLIMPTIWMQIVMNVSALTACIPGMQQFLADLRPGMTVLTVRSAHLDTSRSGSVFGTPGRTRAIAYKGPKGGAWELNELGSIMQPKRTSKQEHRHSPTESVVGLTETALWLRRSSPRTWKTEILWPNSGRKRLCPARSKAD
jgi:hypothetical protein